MSSSENIRAASKYARAHFELIENGLLLGVEVKNKGKNPVDAVRREFSSNRRAGDEAAGTGPGSRRKISFFHFESGVLQ
jgi:hypothetical protein